LAGHRDIAFEPFITEIAHLVTIPELFLTGAFDCARRSL